MNKIAVGIDLGGTKTEIIALSGANVLHRFRENTEKSYAGSIQQIKDMIAKMKNEIKSSIKRVGIGTPGTISKKTGLIKNANSTWLIGKPMQKDLEKLLRIEVVMEDDANCLALSEAVDGAGKDFDSVFAIILGTGVGGGIAINGKIVSGANSVAGEWGHNSLPWPKADELPGRQCYCGKFGCIETFLSGPAIEFFHPEFMATEVAEQAKNLDPNANQTMDKYHDRLARSLASVVNILDPDVIVVAGGLCNIESIYREVPKLLPKYVFSDSVETPIVKAKHGDASGVRGAAWL